MDLHSALLVPAIYACVAAAAVGVLLRLMARFARRVGDVPHCAGCDYALTGISSECCPECGKALTAKNVLKGLRPPCRGLRVLGLVLLLGGVLALGPIAYQRLTLVDWYFYRSAENVIADAASLDKATADRAWSELGRRQTLGRLSAEAEQKLITAALDEYAKPRGSTRSPNWQLLVNHLGKRFEANALTPVQAQRFLEQFCRVTLSARPIVALGDAGAYRLDDSIEAPNDVDKSWAVSAECVALILDGEVISNSRRVINGSSRNVSKAIADRFPVSKPGLHQLSARCYIRIWCGDLQTYELIKEVPTLERIIEAHCPFTVVDRPATEMVELVDADESAMRSTIAVFPLSWRGVEIQIAMPPEDVAFDAAIRIGSEEKSLGAITLQKGQSHAFQLGRHKGLQNLKIDVVDIVLRPSSETARGIVEFYRIWGREMLFKDVKVNHEPEPEFLHGIPIPARPRPPATQAVAP